MSDKSMPKYTHLKRRGATYYFRMRVPADLESHYGRKEITFSLKTTDGTEAKRRVITESARHLDEFERIRMTATPKPVDTLSPEAIQRITNEFSHDVLAGDEAERKTGRVSEGHRLGIEILEDHARPVLAGDWDHDQGQSHRWMSNLVRNFTEALSLKVDPKSDVENDLIYAFSEASIKVVEAIKERDQGKVIPTPVNSSVAPLSGPRGLHSDVSISLSTAIDKYSLEQQSAGNWNEKTALENRAVFNLLISIITDIPMSSFGFFHAVSFKETLQRLPANLNKSPRYRNSSLTQILEMPNVKPMSITTVNKYLTRLSSLLDWSEKHGHVSKNFAEGLSIAQRGKKASDDRAMFQEAHIIDIFRAIKERRVTSSGNVSPFHYWAPLLGFTTGARVNEIASLRLQDFKEEDGIPYIQIVQQDNGKGTKTVAGHRYLPLHPALIRLGLLEYVELLKATGETRLFPELPLVKHKGYGAKISSWFSGHDSKEDGFLWRDAVIREDKLSFHSFRHTMATLLERAEIDSVLQKRIMGHSLKGNVTSDRYSKGPLLSQLLGAIVKTIPEAPFSEMPTYSSWIEIK